jgi:DNA-binding NtrC family response regulator
MSIRLFKPDDLSPQTESAIDHWISDLGAEYNKWAEARQAPLQDEPFIIAGDTSAIDGYLGSLDSQTAGLLKQFPRFWILTSSAKYRHARLPDVRQVVLDWHAKDQELIRAALLPVHFFCVGDWSADDLAALEGWTTQILALRIETSRARPADKNAWNRALRSIWLGEPFVLAGKPADLDRYFHELDAPAAVLLKDCAYFWVLTNCDDYRNSRLPSGRVIALNWRASGQNLIREAIRQLARFPRLRGLSHDSHRLREEIERVARDKTGPGCSVLILGPSGAGKEEVAQSLFRLSDRASGRLQSISGAWLNMEPGMAMTEVVGLARGAQWEQCEGLLKQLRDGAIFFDDFESAPIYIQETLLRIMSVPEGAEAPFRPVGAAREEFTNAWLLFATNKNLREFFSEKGLRTDFLYRFGARIIGVSALHQRPADIPAIAHALWESIWRDLPPDDRRREPLRSEAVRALVAKGIQWEGNVRTLAALLKLAASRMRDSTWNGVSQARLIESITDRGPTYMDWIGPVVSGAFRGPSKMDEQHRERQRAVRVTETDEARFKAELEAALDPSAASLVHLLDKALRQRKKSGKASNDPGRHLFFAVLVHLAGQPDRPIGSTALQAALGIRPTQMNKLCRDFSAALDGPLRALCTCERGGRNRYSFRMNAAILRKNSGANPARMMAPTL